jgi:hypothetical protein
MVRKIVRLVVIFLIVCMATSMSYGQQKYTYFTGDPITVAWSDTNSPQSSGYELMVKEKNGDLVVVQTMVIGDTSKTFVINSAGVYVVYCRPWNYDSGETAKYFASWANSLNSGMVGSVSGAWEIVIKIKPVGPLDFSF